MYRYDGTTWIQQQKLIALDGSAGDQFGCSVSISDNLVIIGARYDDIGSAYIYRYLGIGWYQESKLLASDAVGQNFGFSVSIHGNVGIVGAIGGTNDNGVQTGAAYVYRYDGWTWIEERKLLASDGADTDFFGGSVALGGDRVIVGAWRDDDHGINSGSAYLFDLPARWCSSDVNADSVTDVLDLEAVILAWGTSDAAADVNNDGIVDVLDLVEVILGWGPCA